MFSFSVNHDSIVGQIFGFFLAGFESTGNILACTLYELAKSQEIQNAVHKEIASVLNNFNNDLTMEALHQMKYLHQVLQGKSLMLDCFIWIYYCHCVTIILLLLANYKYCCLVQFI